MKKKLFFAAMALSVVSMLMFSCKKEKESSELIVGKWKSNDKSYIFDQGQQYPMTDVRTWEFKADGTMTMAGDARTYTIDGNKLELIRKKNDAGAYDTMRFTIDSLVDDYLTVTPKPFSDANPTHYEFNKVVE